MSTPPDFDLDLDLQLLPAWARQPSTDNRYAKFEGEPEGDRFRRRGDRPGYPDQRRDRPPRREFPGGPRPRGEGRPGGPPHAGGPPRTGGDRPDRGRPWRREDRREDRREPPAPLPDVNVTFTPDDKGVESLARQIKLHGRAYPLFDIAGLVLQKPDRYRVEFTVQKGPDGKPVQPLFVCSLDDSLWLSETEVVAHALKNHFATFYQTERVATDPPKGTYTFVAQCGMSGVILGPPNYHDYQDKLRKLHAERFARMPFETFKARVKIVKDEAVVKKWVEDLSWKVEYVGLNIPEPLKLSTREEVEKHFRETHLPNLIKTVETYTLAPGPQRAILAPPLQTLLRQALEDQRRFPLRIATVLSQQFAGQGLQFFKVNKTVTHVCVARPRHLDFEHTVISEGVRRIVEFINHTPGCTRRKLVEALAPTPPRPPALPATAPPAAEPGAATAPAPAPPAESVEPTPEQTALISDLHWLIHQGHVIEFADGRMETAKAPKPRPIPAPQPAKPVAAAPPAPAQGGTPAEVAAPPPAASPTTGDAAPVAAPETDAPATPGVELPAPTPNPPPEPAAGPIPGLTEPAPQVTP